MIQVGENVGEEVYKLLSNDDRRKVQDLNPYQASSQITESVYKKVTM
jgi:hypothetical protein